MALGSRLLVHHGDRRGRQSSPGPSASDDFLTGTRIAGDGSIWWVVPALLLVGSIGSRLLIDMWSSRLSSTALIFAAIAYLTALAAFFHGIVLQSDVSQLLLVQGTLLGGHLLLAMSMGLARSLRHARCRRGLPKRSLKKKAEKKVAKKAAEKESRPNGPDAAAIRRRRICGKRRERTRPTQTTARKNPTTRSPAMTWVAVDPPHGGSQPS